MSEFELLARVRERLPAPGPQVRVGSGDDAAVTVPTGATATSVDALIEGVHFRRGQGSLAQIGHKALAVALSDLAAMGAEPGEAYVVLGVPPDLDEDGCMEVLDGIADLSATTGTSLAGGDVTRAPVLMLAVTVVGHAPSPAELVTRAGALPGDALVLTGEIGAAAAGLLALERPATRAAVSASVAERLQAHQLEPQPRIAAGRALAEAGANAMIDLSDGLGGDAKHLAEASGVGLQIDAGALPVAAGVGDLAAAAGKEPLQLAISGGEDYELLAALPAEQLQVARAAVGAHSPLSRIGQVVAGSGVEIRLPGGEPLNPTGFDQFD
ncbi:MAG TPA: thiamine-phosphate kinase [Solirubrobacterales bacterium]|jgi:thiamine-monophosphate kinase